LGCFARRGVLPIVPAHPQQPLQCLGSRSLRPLARRPDPPVPTTRPCQRGVAYTKVCAALKHLAAFDLHPYLNRQPPLSCPTGAFIKDNDRCAARVSGAAWTRGGGGLGDGSSGALGGGTSTLLPLDPWQVLHINF